MTTGKDNSGEGEKMRFCPLKSHFEHKIECMGDECAWMMRGGCAITIVALELRAFSKQS